MARLRHVGAFRKATRLREDAEELRRSMRHDSLMQMFATAALPNLIHLERRAAMIVAAEEAVDAALTSREVSELMLRASSGDEAAMFELARRRALPAAA